MSAPTDVLPPLGAAPRRPDLRFMLAHPAHAIALAFGCGLSPWAPGTVGTLWGWLVFVVLRPWVDDTTMAAILVGGFWLGWWASTVTARHLGQADPGSVVWDEVLAIWLVLWLVTPASLLAQTVAFALFRFFDAVKPGPVAWADRAFKRRGPTPVGAAQGFGIMFDDLVAALCTLLVIALWTWF